jgi:hypothetical protein
MTPDELAAKLKSHPFASVCEPLMSRIVLTVLRHSQQRTPVRTGTLRRSLTTRVQSSGGSVRGFVGSNLRYAAPVHEGHGGVTGRPFIREGIEDSRGEISTLLQAAGDHYFKDIAK